jgi:hypothetical protein
VKTNFTRAARAPAVSRGEEKGNEATGSGLKTAQGASQHRHHLLGPDAGAVACHSVRKR